MLLKGVSIKVFIALGHDVMMERLYCMFADDMLGFNKTPPEELATLIFRQLIR